MSGRPAAFFQNSFRYAGGDRSVFRCAVLWATIRGTMPYPTDWDFYITFRDDQLASVMVNLALRNVAPIEDLPECVTIAVPLRSPNEQGLSTPEERPQMDAIEDALRDAVAADGDWLFAGRRITGGRFELVFFAVDGCNPVRIVERVMARFPDYEGQATTAHDPEWEAYLRDLFPNQVELRQILNQRLLRDLESEGDDLSRPRPVCHTIIFPNVMARADFVVAIEGREFDIEEVDLDADDVALPYGLRLVRNDPIDHRSINEISIDLLLLAEQYEGRYAGWEADVARGA